MLAHWSSSYQPKDISLPQVSPNRLVLGHAHPWHPRNLNQFVALHLHLKTFWPHQSLAPRAMCPAHCHFWRFFKLRRRLHSLFTCQNNELATHLIKQAAQALQLRLELPVMLFQDLHASLQPALVLPQQTSFRHHVLKIKNPRVYFLVRQNYCNSEIQSWCLEQL